MEALSDSTLAALAGLVGGVVLGLAARRGRFCTLGAIEDAMYAQDWRGVRMWGLALSAAIALSFAFAAMGLFDPADSIYLSQAWNPAASIVGGLMFGYGMALAGNCGYGALARMGGGDLRAFVVVVVMGVSAYMAIGGPTGWLRNKLFPPQFLDPGDALPGIAQALSGAFGVPALAVGLGAAALLAAASLSNAEFLGSRKHVVWGVAVGVSIASGWALTGVISAQAFEPVAVESHTFSAPLGESLLFLMTSTGNEISFGVGSVAGVLLGALLGCVQLGHFRWEACDDAAELGRQIFGAFLMGTGGVVALGCSVGQGLSAFSLLSYSAPVTLAAIVIGAAFGLRRLIEGFHAI